MKRVSPAVTGTMVQEFGSFESRLMRPPQEVS